MKKFTPSYIKNRKSIKKKAEKLYSFLNKCSLCPRYCGAKRVNGEKGFCGSEGTKILVSSYHPHFGEEKELVGRYGSGTIFFSNCPLKCVFCQNWEITHLGYGKEISIDELSGIMLYLQSLGCHNINLVTPEHYLPFIILALDKAVEEGLNIPLVYNTSGWVSVEILKIIDGLIDIYLPDFKFIDEKLCEKYLQRAIKYPDTTKKAIIEMNRQVGKVKINEEGIITQGLMIRHLVMPENLKNSFEIIKWISENLPEDTYINIMSQYRPCYKANDFPEISRSITQEEFFAVIKYGKTLGLKNINFK